MRLEKEERHEHRIGTSSRAGRAMSARPPLDDILSDPVGAARHLGREIGVSTWVDVPQERITTFGRNTGDEYWIHMDPERARRESPFGGSTIAHGFLLLSLLAEMFYKGILQGKEYSGLNYGLDRVRFLNPVKAGSRLRGHFTLQHVRPTADGANLTWAVTVECEGSDQPALVAEWICRMHTPAQS